jgi:hypothetical protein
MARKRKQVARRSQSSRRVFVSYSHDDSKYVSPVVKILQGTNDWVFVDTTSIPAGTRWPAAIKTALGVADLIVLFWCYHAKISEHVTAEWRGALGNKKDVMPILLDDEPLPGELRSFQWVDFRSFETHVWQSVGPPPGSTIHYHPNADPVIRSWQPPFRADEAATVLEDALRRRFRPD